MFKTVKTQGKHEKRIDIYAGFVDYYKIQKTMNNLKIFNNDVFQRKTKVMTTF